MYRIIKYFIVFILISFWTYKVADNNVFSLHFVDEEDHIVFASYMNQGYKLYTDLSSNHQPIPYVFSAIVQKLSNPPNMPMLIKRHRQAIFFYGLFWGLMFMIFFRFKGLLAWVTLEMLKYALLGNQVLAESLALYPSMFLFWQTLRMLWQKIELSKSGLLFLGFCFFLVGFNLVPLWPFLLVILLLWLYSLKVKITPLLLGILIPIILLFLAISPLDWFNETIYNNTVYAMPQLNNLKTPWQKISLLIFPFLALGKSWFGQTIVIIFGLMIWSLSIWLIRKDKQKLMLLLLFYILAVLSNTRVDNPAATIFEGFHLLPWLGIWVALGIFLYHHILLSENKTIIGFIGGVALVILFSNHSMPYFQKKDTATEYYVNYSNFEDNARILNILQQPQDRLAVLTSESLIYWQSGMRPATRQIVYYPWEESVPDLQKDYQNMLTQNNPEFVYGGREQNLVANKYLNIVKNNEATELYVRVDRAKQITSEQIEAIEQFGFSL